MCGFHDARHCEQIFIPSCLQPRQREGKIISDSEGSEITELSLGHYTQELTKHLSDVD
jgi:hypothetical protein